MQKGNDTLQIRIMNFKTMSVLVHLLNLKCTDNEKLFHYGTKNFLLIMLMSVALLSMPKAFAWDVSVKPISDKLVLKTNDTRWIRLGAGYRGTGLWTENLNGNLSSGHYSNDNARLYLNGQINQYLKFEVNTECFFCNNTATGENPRMSYNILDAIAKFEYNRYFNIWGGRMLAPTERGELSGPFFQATHDAFKTPFFSQDFSVKFGEGGAGRYGRDDGVTFWGNAAPGFVPGTLGYAMGVFRGLESSHTSGPNSSGTVLTAARVTYNFLNPEKNPGYYTSSTYYGKAGDILAVAFGMSYQKNGAGSSVHRSDFLGFVGDALFEKVLPNNMGVFTANGEYKQFYANYSTAAFSDKDCFCMFDGKSWTITGLYLIPHKIGIGQFQPYGRFTSVQPNHSSSREEIETGVNYIIDGFNARISAYYQHGDLLLKGLNYAPGIASPAVDVFKMSFQLQI
ncbi:short chain amide porin [Nitrosomonas oligotropha]|uniref:Short chain amide porin n=2 Tax=Nitrosomonas oligotropha TaxID=42354 RepID=A0A1H8RSU6_9PROT|nr:short chain amide porin [Nitrosomonas oligotropha]SEO69699.1 short chain amide porin [Nitrosomonas oligotropha]